MNECPTLHGRLVTLVPLAESDVDELTVAASESRSRYRFAHVPDGRAEMHGWVRRVLAEQAAGRSIPFVIRSTGGAVVGTTSMHLDRWRWPAGSDLARGDFPDAVEIGSTWLADSAQRTGVNTEAKLMLLTHAFETWRVHRVRLRTDARNMRSRQAIERLGARPDGILRGDFPGADGTVRDSAYYSILAPEWPEVRDALTARLRAG